MAKEFRVEEENIFNAHQVAYPRNATSYVQVYLT